MTTTAPTGIAPPPGAIQRPPPPPVSGAASVPVADVDSLFTVGDDIEKGKFVVVGGPPKYGKTTFANGAPNPAFIFTDQNGMGSLPKTVKRLTPETWPAVMAALTSLRDKPHGYKSVVLDTVFKAEAMLIRHLCEKDGNKAALRLVGGGWGAGVDMLVGEINKIVDLFFALNKKGINTIAISQLEVQTVKDPVLDDYEKGLREYTYLTF